MAVFSRWGERIVLSCFTNAIPFSDIACRVDKFMDGVDEWNSGDDSIDGKTKSTAMLPVVLPGEVNKLAQYGVWVLHPPSNRSNGRITHAEFVFIQEVPTTNKSQLHLRQNIFVPNFLH